MSQPTQTPTHILNSPLQQGCKSRALVAVLIILAVIVADQVIKYQIKTTFSLYEFYIIFDWFQLVFTENRGMAFGMDFIGTMALAVFRVAAIGFFVWVLVGLVRRRAAIGLIVCLSMVIAGAIGNIIDNMINGLIYTESIPFAAPAQLVPPGEGYGTFLSGKVIDMFYFPLFTWPDWMPLVGGKIFFGAIFNFADASISCGAVAAAIFYHKHFTREQFLGVKSAEPEKAEEETAANGDNKK